MDHPIISADSHVTEPPNTYLDYIDPKWQLPSEYFRENIYTTFQDDWVAFQTVDLVNWRRLMWANDFPHSDSTWPRSQEMLAEHARHLTPEQRRAILYENVKELYRLAA